MSSRLHVVLSDEEHARFKACAESEGVSFSTWVRTALELAERSRPRRSPEEKLAALERAAGIADDERLPMPPIDRYEEYRDWYERTRFGALPEP